MFREKKTKEILLNDNSRTIEEISVFREGLQLLPRGNCTFPDRKPDAKIMENHPTTMVRKFRQREIDAKL